MFTEANTVVEEDTAEGLNKEWQQTSFVWTFNNRVLFYIQNVTLTFSNFRRKAKSVICKPNKLCMKLVANIRKTCLCIFFFSYLSLKEFLFVSAIVWDTATAHKEIFNAVVGLFTSV